MRNVLVNFEANKAAQIRAIEEEYAAKISEARQQFEALSMYLCTSEDEYRQREAANNNPDSPF